MMVAVLMRVVRAALLAHVEGLKPKERRAFVGRFLRHMGLARVRSIRDPKPDPASIDWLAENLPDMLDHG